LAVFVTLTAFVVVGFLSHRILRQYGHDLHNLQAKNAQAEAMNQKLVEALDKVGQDLKFDMADRATAKWQQDEQLTSNPADSGAAADTDALTVGIHATDGKTQDDSGATAKVLNVKLSRDSNMLPALQYVSHCDESRGLPFCKVMHEVLGSQELHDYLGAPLIKLSPQGSIKDARIDFQIMSDPFKPEHIGVIPAILVNLWDETTISHPKMLHHASVIGLFHHMHYSNFAAADPSTFAIGRKLLEFNMMYPMDSDVISE
jgi:hypothetical protein